jgi:hypothetical protein
MRYRFRFYISSYGGRFFPIGLRAIGSKRDTELFSFLNMPADLLFMRLLSIFCLNELKATLGWL